MKLKPSKTSVIKGGLALILFILVVLITSTTVHSIDSRLPSKLQTTASYQQASLVDLINQVRAKGGKAPLSQDNALNQASVARNAYMIAHQDWAHDGTDGSHWYSIVEQYAPDRNNYGENLAACYTSNQEVVTAWVNSPEHYAIMMGDYTQVGYSNTYVQGTMTDTYHTPSQTFSSCFITTAEFSN